MRISLLTLSFVPEIGGVQTYLFELARRLAQVHAVEVITPVQGQLPAGAAMRRTTLDSGRAREFRRALRATGPDRVLVGHAHPQLLLAAAFHTRLRYITIAHGNDYLAAQGRWHRPLFNWLLRQSRPLVTQTAANAARLQQILGIRPRVVHPGTDPLRFTPAADLPPGPPVLLTVGRLVPRKGVDTVLQALPALLPHFPGLRYEIAGEGPDRGRLEAQATDLGLREAVTFHGALPPAELPALYRRAHLFVMPVREERAAASVEGFGIVYLEASASGLPVIAGRSGGAVEAVVEGQTGYLVAPNDAAALAERMQMLLADLPLRRQLGRNGRRWVESTMNWDRAAAELREIVEG